MRFARSIAAALCLTTIGVAAQQQDLLTQLGTTVEQVNENVMLTLTSGAVALAGQRSIFKAASPEERAVFVRAAFAAARAYTTSAAFTARYAQWREAIRPAPENLPRSGDEALVAQQRQLDEMVKQAQRMSAELPAEARQQLEENVAAMKKQLAELNADPEHRKTIDAAAKEAASAADADFARREAEFEATYPADPRKLIATRLKAFLQLSAGIDFSASLVERDKRMRFENVDLEAKPREWKMLFRAGQAAVDAGRAAAQEWLKAIEG